MAATKVNELPEKVDDYYGEDYYDNEADGVDEYGEYYGEEAGGKPAKGAVNYKTTKTKKFKKGVTTLKNNLDDSAAAPAIRKRMMTQKPTLIKKKQPNQKK